MHLTNSNLNSSESKMLLELFPNTVGWTKRVDKSGTVHYELTATDQTILKFANNILKNANTQTAIILRNLEGRQVTLSVTKNPSQQIETKENSATTTTSSTSSQQETKLNASMSVKDEFESFEKTLKSRQARLSQQLHNNIDEVQKLLKQENVREAIMKFSWAIEDYSFFIDSDLSILIKLWKTYQMFLDISDDRNLAPFTLYEFDANLKEKTEQVIHRYGHQIEEGWSKDPLSLLNKLKLLPVKTQESQSIVAKQIAQLDRRNELDEIEFRMYKRATNNPIDFDQFIRLLQLYENFDLTPELNTDGWTKTVDQSGVVHHELTASDQTILGLANVILNNPDAQTRTTLRNFGKGYVTLSVTKNVTSLNQQIETKETSSTTISSQQETKLKASTSADSEVNSFEQRLKSQQERLRKQANDDIDQMQLKFDDNNIHNLQDATQEFFWALEDYSFSIDSDLNILKRLWETYNTYIEKHKNQELYLALQKKTAEIIQSHWPNQMQEFLYANDPLSFLKELWPAKTLEPITIFERQIALLRRARELNSIEYRMYVRAAKNQLMFPQFQSLLQFYEQFDYAHDPNFQKLSLLWLGAKDVHTGLIFGETELLLKQMTLALIQEKCPIFWQKWGMAFLNFTSANHNLEPNDLNYLQTLMIEISEFLKLQFSTKEGVNAQELTAIFYFQQLVFENILAIETQRDALAQISENEQATEGQHLNAQQVRFNQILNERSFEVENYNALKEDILHSHGVWYYYSRLLGIKFVQLFPTNQ